MWTLHLTPVVVLATAVCAGAACDSARLTARVRPANPREYKAILDAQNWPNPFLIVTTDGVAFKSASSPEWKPVPIDGLRRILLDLPTSDWRLGRVVGLQDPSIVPQTGSARFEKWNETIDRHRRNALEILKALGIEASRWPSG